MNYGNVDSSYSGYSVKIPNTFSSSTNSFRLNEVDGWGLLTTPFGSFNTLRVKTIITAHDSLFLDTLGFGFGISVPQQIEYKWIGKGE
jgi:hypothetical protein